MKKREALALCSPHHLPFLYRCLMGEHSDVLRLISEMLSVGLPVGCTAKRILFVSCVLRLRHAAARHALLFRPTVFRQGRAAHSFSLGSKTPLLSRYRKGDGDISICILMVLVLFPSSYLNGTGSFGSHVVARPPYPSPVGRCTSTSGRA